MSQWTKQADAKDNVVEEKTIKKQRKTLSEVFQSAEEKVEQDKRSTLRTLVWGKPGHGKTSMIMSAKRPLYIIACEPGWETVYEMLKPEHKKDVHIVEAFALDEVTDEPDPGLSLDKIDEAVSALRDVKEGTIAVDTTTEVWRWIQRWWERKQGQKPQYQFQWQGANVRYENLMLRLATRPCNIIFTAKSSELYDTKGQPTGTYQPRTQKETQHWVDLVIYLRKSPDPAIPNTPIEFKALIEKNRLRETINGKAISIEFDVPDQGGWTKILDILAEQYKIPEDKLRNAR